MSSAMSMALNLISLSPASVARQSVNFYPSVSERYSFAKSTTSKQLIKRLVAVASHNKSSASAVSTCGENASAARVSPGFRPSVWGDFFLKYEAMEPFSEEQNQELKRLREEIIMLLKRIPDTSSLKLDLVDIIQRLGVSYQFEDEIESSLSDIHSSYYKETANDLHTVALRFRLLRHQGHYVSSDVLKKFMNQEGQFDENLANDVRGLLSLYEASHYRVHGENILEEALRFTTTTLERMGENTSGFMAKQINLALKWPIRKTLNRVIARGYILLYEQDESHNEVLLKFAKLDFNRVQRIHQQELCALTKWWKGIDCPKNYPFVRDRLVENYFGVVGYYFQPQYCLARKIMMIFLNTFTIIDDIYDAYGSTNELLLLTDAIERWNIDAVNQLPPYIRPCYQFILKSYVEMGEELAKYGKAERLQYAKAAVKQFIKFSYKDAYWHDIGYLPTYEEYMENGVISNGICFLLTSSYMGMGDVVTKEVLNWIASEPLAIRAASTISRLTDDIYDHEDTVHATAVECYKNQFSVSRQEAIEEIQKQISEAWKDLSKECLYPTAVPMTILERPLNHARMIFTMFKYGDGYTNLDSKSTQLVKSILVDPIM